LQHLRAIAGPCAFPQGKLQVNDGPGASREAPSSAVWEKLGEITRRNRQCLISDVNGAAMLQG